MTAYISPMHDSLYFTDHHLQVRDMVRDFAQQVVKPSARRYDLASEFPWDNVRQMADLGLFGVPWPEELGGSGMDYLSYIMVIHELAKVDASHAITVSAHTTLGTSPIMDFGTDEQKRTYVPRLAAGKVLGGFGLTEPGAGSDAGGTRTVAEEKRDHYVLNGSKIFITHAGVGEIFVVTARTDPAAKKTHGITAFIVTKDTTDLEEAKRVGVGHDPSLPKCRGVAAAKKEDKLGWRASDTRELVFQDAIVPKENVLGPVNNGFRRGPCRIGSPCPRHRGRRARGVLAIHDDQTTIRQTDRRVPGCPLRPRRHGDRDRGSPTPRLPRRMAQAARPAIQEGGGHGEALRLRARHARYDQSRAAARRVRLHDGLPGGADDAGCEDLRDRGGDE